MLMVFLTVGPPKFALSSTTSLSESCLIWYALSALPAVSSFFWGVHEAPGDHVLLPGLAHSGGPLLHTHCTSRLCCGLTASVGWSLLGLTRCGQGRALINKFLAIRTTDPLTRFVRRREMKGGERVGVKDARESWGEGGMRQVG